MYACSSHSKLYGTPRFPLILLTLILALFCCTIQALPLAGEQVPNTASIISASSSSSRNRRHTISREVTLRSECSNRLVETQYRGKRVSIRADGPGHICSNDLNKSAILLMKSTGSFASGSVTIMSNTTKEYLCFSTKGKLVMRAKMRKSLCTFKEDQEKRGEETLFRYSIEVPEKNSESPQKFYLGFRNSGVRLRVNQWQSKEKCTYFKKEQKHPIPKTTQDRYAPSLDGLYDSSVNRDGSYGCFDENNINSAPNPNKPFAPDFGPLQKFAEEGIRIRHGKSKRRKRKPNT